jgi:hypothetical protein
MDLLHGNGSDNSASRSGRGGGNPCGSRNGGGERGRGGFGRGNRNGRPRGNGIAPLVSSVAKRATP